MAFLNALSEYHNRLQLHRNQRNQRPTIEIIEWAQDVLDRFISQNSKEALNIGSDLRKEVRSNFSHLKQEALLEYLASGAASPTSKDCQSINNMAVEEPFRLSDSSDTDLSSSTSSPLYTVTVHSQKHRSKSISDKASLSDNSIQRRERSGSSTMELEPASRGMFTRNKSDSDLNKWNDMGPSSSSCAQGNVPSQGSRWRRRSMISTIRSISTSRQEQQGHVMSPSMTPSSPDFSLDSETYHRHFNLFSRVEEFVLFQIKLDIFPRFVQSARWLRFLSENRHIWQRIAFEKSTADQSFYSIRSLDGSVKTILYSREDFLKPQITDRDLMFSASVYEDSSTRWLLIKDSADHRTQCYLSNCKYIVGDGLGKKLDNMAMTKMVSTVPYSYDKVFNMLSNVRFFRRIDAHISDMKLLDTLPATVDRKHPSVVMAIETARPHVLLSRRQFVIVGTCKHDEKKERYTLFAKSCPYGKAATSQIKKKGFKRGTVLTGFVVQKVHTDLTRIVWYTCLNLGGWLRGGIFSNDLFRSMCEQRCEMINRNLMKCLQEYESEGFPCVDADLQMPLLCTAFLTSGVQKRSVPVMISGACNESGTTTESNDIATRLARRFSSINVSRVDYDGDHCDEISDVDSLEDDSFSDDETDESTITE